MWKMQNVKVGMYFVYNLVKIRFSDEYEKGVHKYENSYASAMENITMFFQFPNHSQCFSIIIIIYEDHSDRR